MGQGWREAGRKAGLRGRGSDREPQEEVVRDAETQMDGQGLSRRLKGRAKPSGGFNTAAG